MESSTNTHTETAQQYTLRLQPPPRHIQWAEDVVDNEHMNKKKTKSK